VGTAMILEEFTAGKYIQQYHYKSFTPTHLNTEWTWSDPKVNTLLAEANLKLGELNAFSLHIPNIDIFIRMHVVKEATTSSRIEGTRTEMEDVVMKKANIDPEKRDDWQEVQNYIKAMNHAIRRLKHVPISTRLLKEIHKILMAGVRGKTKLPGEYRRSQNWVGGATLHDAVFVPPLHTEVPSLMGDLEDFLHNDQIPLPDLVRIAMSHYQFETIHPFLDGNGRIGRLLITLYLVSNNILSKPMLYLSAYFEKHKPLYYDNLMRVRTNNDLLQWIRFFLVAVTETSKQGIATFKNILALREDVESRRLITLGKKLPRAKKLLTHLYKSTSVTAAEVGALLRVTPATANAFIRDFVRLGILREATGGKRNRVFTFHEYMNLFLDSGR
jgi:Fic family protein